MREKLCDMIWDFLNITDEEEMKICIGSLDKEFYKYGYEK